MESAAAAAAKKAGEEAAANKAEEQLTGSMIVLETADGRSLNVELPARSRPVHPSQIYSALNALVLCIFLLAYFPFQQRDGESMAFFMLLYPASRFMLEIIRSDEQGIWGTGMTISQNISLVVLVASVGVWFYVLRRPRGTVWQGQFA